MFWMPPFTGRHSQGRRHTRETILQDKASEADLLHLLAELLGRGIPEAAPIVANVLALSSVICLQTIKRRQLLHLRGN
jgi:hypothetical protein